MNTNYPHDILPENLIPETLRDAFMPVSDKEAQELAAKMPDQRAKYLEGRLKALEEMEARGRHARSDDPE